MGFNTFSGGAAAPTNPNILPEIAGLGANGQGTTITAHASAHTLGTAVQMVASTSAAWSGFTLALSTASSGGIRYLVYVSTDNASANLIVPPLFAQPNTTGVQNFEIPLQVAAGTSLYVAIRASTGGATLQAEIIGWDPDGTGNAPGYTTADALTTAATGTTQASSTDITVATDASTFSSVSASLGQSYGAFLVCFGASTNPTNAGHHTVRLGKGAGNTVIGARAFGVTAGSPGTNRFSVLFNGPASSGEALGLNIQGPTGGNVFQACVIGFR